MSTLLQKLYLVKPFSPNPAVDWEKVRLDGVKSENGGIGWLSSWDFEDPIVAKEFRVYMNRDVAPIVYTLAYVNSPFWLLTKLVNIEEDPYLWGLAMFIPAFFGWFILFFDAYLYWNLQADLEKEYAEISRLTRRADWKRNRIAGSGGKDNLSLEQQAEDDLLRQRDQAVSKRETYTKYRSWSLLLTTAGNTLLQGSVMTWSLRNRNCVNASDYSVAWGWRPSLGLEQENNLAVVSSQCSKTIHPFPLCHIAIGVVALTSHSKWIVLSQVLIVIHQLLGGLYYPFDDQPFLQDWISRICVLLANCFVGAAFHYYRRQSSIAQFKQQLILEQERSKADRVGHDVSRILANILPPSALERVLKDEVVADYASQATVLFSDLKDFTNWSSQRTPRQVVDMLDTLVMSCDLAATVHKVEKIKTIGDAYWAVAGLPEPSTNHAHSVCGLGRSLVQLLHRHNQEHPEWEDIGIRVGIHSGPLYGGIFGSQQLSYEVFGDTNKIAAMVEQAGKVGSVCITEDTAALLGLHHDGSTSSLEFLVRLHPLAADRQQTQSWQRYDLATQKEVWNSEPVSIFIVPNDVDLDVSAAGARKGVNKEEDKFTDAVEQSVKVISPTRANTHSSVIPLLPSPAHHDHHQRREQLTDARKLLTKTSTTHHYNASGTAVSLDGGVEEMVDKQHPEGIEFEEDTNSNEKEEENTSNLLSTLEIVTEKYTKRKFKYVFPELLDPEAEKEFLDNLRITLHRPLIAGRVVAIILTVSMLIGLVLGMLIDEEGIAIDQRRPRGRSEPSALVLFCLSILTSTADLLLWVLVNKAGNIFLWRFQAALSQIAGALNIVAIFFSFGASVGTNSISHLFLPQLATLMVANVGFVSTFTLTGANAALLILLYGCVWDRKELAIALPAGPLALLVCVMICLVLERLYRQQFEEMKIAQYIRGQQDERNKQREDLLRAMVPKHIVKELTAWMGRGMLPEETIVHNLPLTCVGFLQFEVPDDLNATDGITLSSPSAKIDWLAQLHKQVDTILDASSGINTTIVKIKTIGDVVMLAGPFASRVSPNGGEEEVVLPSSNSVSPKGLQSHRQLDEEESADIPRSSSAFDAQRGRAADSEDHEKNPFIFSPSNRNADTLKKAARELLQIVKVIHTDVTKNFRGGLHVGELVGAVLGNTRLCFDIFGDSVNTASRVMTSGGTSVGDICASIEFRAVLLRGKKRDACEDEKVMEESELDVMKGFCFSGSIQVEAKGKGKIEVSRLLPTSKKTAW